MIAALFVEKDGCYFGLPGVDPWAVDRDARDYPGPYPVVAHPPCERWGKYWRGGPSATWQRKLGDDDGCFASALALVRKWGGVLEHPAFTHAWAVFGLEHPPRNGGWTPAGSRDAGRVCYVEQGHYGHLSRKPTWLYAVAPRLPELIWREAPQRLSSVALQRYGYEKARKLGMIPCVGGKGKYAARARTPPEFRNVLIGIAESACV